MITMTAIVRPVESLRSFPQLGQNLRRHYEHTLLFTDQMFVIFPGIGAVLVTEHSSRYRFDIVGTDQAIADHRVMKLEAYILNETGGQRIRFDWAKAAHVPVPFR
ncbi:MULTISPECIES: hypothetical protein [Cryobacterium]|uniref:DUF2218 domain-containing protein n=1 Tax=Cryobacterium zongtaii TaxID=1259217 RepID=A0A2S3ZFT7_9MICO|nr:MULTISPECIES: hypothetical protein [Cryobacterium]ASD22480.1 hypothetical protein B7495_10585 [Cryobacterium sp. LW097]MEC5186096.1 hypothetical protein [Cryobacterium sp. MP_3.1]POH64587.1 hypothetical protein C3B60_14265 [Cryobacterium zongtaii]POH65977.1 hypothetical protein C3B61_09435 [Cryobacterium zongtaii]POH71219.1 hypothetical protein C3B59_01015 [Cryobacterium zongtaii]